MSRRLRLVSFNIAHARGWMPHQGLVSKKGIQRTLDRIAGLLGELRPDIVALQEIDSDSIWNGSFDHVDYLREKTGLPYAAFGASNDLGGPTLRLCYGNAVLSRHPIVLTEAHRFGSRAVGEKGLLYVEVELGRCTLPVVSLHLHHRSRLQRLRQARHVLALLARKPRSAHRLPPLVAGDFNCAAHRPGDAGDLLLAGESPLEGYTYAPVRMPTFPALRPTRMLDYWLLPPGWNVLHTEAPRTRTSDHLPVVVDVEPAAYLEP